MDARHPASDKKRRRLRAQGNLPPVQDLSQALVWAGFGAGALALAGSFLESLHRLTLASFQAFAQNPGKLDPQILSQVGGLALSLAVFLGCLGALVFVLPWAWTGFPIALVRLGRNPWRGFAGGSAEAVQRTALGIGLHLAVFGFAALKLFAWLQSPQPLAIGLAQKVRFLLGLGLGTVLLEKVFWAYLSHRRYEDSIAMSDEEKRREAEEEAMAKEVRSARDEMGAELMTKGRGGDSQ